ncbi:MAG TPA: zf-HC2 domain-containing protein, partial [Vicinamibacteria bacterium]|nr:zf-HC2 domain-containing protein [Vicinamibacteria bacterium]
MTCPDPGQIAAHVERRLPAAEAARMDEHIAGCAECYQVFADTVEFALAEREAAGVPGATPHGALRLPFRKPWFLLAAGLVLAAGLAGFLGWFTLSTGRHSSSPVAQLAQAVGAHRFVEPRLTGGFSHGRLVVLRSGETPQKLDAQPAAVIAAVARIRAQAEGDTSPRTLGALAITYLVSGDVAAAVKALESATAQEPDNPGLLSDLAAAYLARAEQMDEPADLPKALEVAEKAITLKDPPTEVWFNRALALEKLHLVDAARKAWEDYLQRDAASAWADEARQHLEALPKPRQSSVEEDKARVKAALEGGQAAVDKLADEDPSLLRDYFEDDLLPAWAEAQLVGHPDANL